jgi:hypothetical protein
MTSLLRWRYLPVPTFLLGIVWTRVLLWLVTGQP